MTEAEKNKQELIDHIRATWPEHVVSSAYAMLVKDYYLDVLPDFLEALERAPVELFVMKPKWEPKDGSIHWGKDDDAVYVTNVGNWTGQYPYIRVPSGRHAQRRTILEVGGHYFKGSRGTNGELLRTPNQCYFLYISDAQWQRVGEAIVSAFADEL